ncbi:GDP-fucose O-fucosyltransferase, partial [Olea europaea subsp. europaea]
MGTLGIDVVNYRDRDGGGSDVVGPGSIYRSLEVFRKLYPFMEAESNQSYNNMLILLFQGVLR